MNSLLGLRLVPGDGANEVHPIGLGLVGRDRGSVAYLNMKARIQLGDDGVPIGEVHLLEPSPNQVFGFNRDGRRDASKSKISSSSSSSLATAVANFFGPQKDVSSCIRWGDGDRRPENAERKDMPDVADTLDEMEDNLVSRHGKMKGSIVWLVLFLPIDPLRSSELPGASTTTCPLHTRADLPVARSEEFLECRPLTQSEE